MTKAEKIKMLEAELRAIRLEHEKVKSALNEYKKREDRFVIVEKAEGGCSEGGGVMTITLDISKSIATGNSPVLAVSVINLNAASDELSFLEDIIKQISEFAKKYGNKG